LERVKGVLEGCQKRKRPRKNSHTSKSLTFFFPWKRGEPAGKKKNNFDAADLIKKNEGRKKKKEGDDFKMAKPTRFPIRQKGYTKKIKAEKTKKNRRVGREPDAEELFGNLKIGKGEKHTFQRNQERGGAASGKSRSKDCKSFPRGKIGRRHREKKNR